MKNFELHHPESVSQATKLLAGGTTSHSRNEGDMPIQSSGHGTQDGATVVMSGGQDLLGLMKDYIVTPDSVVDLKRIKGLNKIEYDPHSGLKIGALVTITDLEENADVRKHFPAIAQAAGSVGSLQIRNVGTVGGNLCQRPRCWYFRNEHAHCLKKGGSHCFAADDESENKYHAILGDGPCHIVHPSDLAPALECLDAVVHVSGSTGHRDIPISEFYVLPQDGGITHETVLKPDEIVTGVTVPASAKAAHSVYIKFREKESFDWAMASVAMAIDGTASDVRSASIVLGGVAPKPWRAKAAEAQLHGKPLTDSTLSAAAHAAVEGASPLSKNAYKVALTQALVRRAGEMLINAKEANNG
jgi:xanthine dehydrogenase YagS FAD-binding subunit